MPKAKYSKETKQLKRDLQKAAQLCQLMGSRATFQVHMRSEEEQQMANELAPTIGLERDEVNPTCWKKVDSGWWFYIFDYRGPK